MKVFQLYTSTVTYENTAEYGFGDYPKTSWSPIMQIVQPSKKKAIARFKEIFPRLTFEGVFTNAKVEVKP